MPIDLNEEVALHDGRLISVYKLIHDFDLAERFIREVAMGASADDAGMKYGYESRRRFARRVRDEAQRLITELDMPAVELRRQSQVVPDTRADADNGKV